MGRQRRVAHLTGDDLLHILFGRHFACVFGVAWDAAIGDHPPQVVALHEHNAFFIEQPGDAVAPPLRAHGDVGAVEGVAAGVVGAEGAAACDLLVGIGVGVVVELDDERGCVADDLAVRFRQQLALREGGILHLVEAGGVEGALRVFGIGGPMAGNQARDILQSPGAHLDLGLPFTCFHSSPSSCN